MHLLIVNPEYPPVGGGAGNAGRFLARALVRQGHRVSVMTSAFDQNRGLSIEDGVRVHRIPALRTKVDRASVGQLLSFAAAGLGHSSRLLRQDDIEAVIAFFTLPSGLIGYRLAHSHQLPYVVSLRGGDVPGLVPELSTAHRWIRPLRHLVLRSAHAVVANSPGLAELSQRSDPFDVAVIPNGVDTTLFRPPTGGSPAAHDAPFRVLFAGRLRPQKNLGHLLKQLARLRRECGMDKLTLHVAGDGPLAPTLHQQAKALELEDMIVWHGWLPKTKLVELYQNVDCFVNPSLYEGSPNTVLEAMASGLPVIASRVLGNDSLIIHGDNGMLFDLCQPNALGDALLELSADRQHAARLGARCRDDATRRPSWEQTALAYLGLLTKP